MIEALCIKCGKRWKVPLPGKKYPCRICGTLIEGVATPPAAIPGARSEAPTPDSGAAVGAPAAPRKRSDYTTYALKYAQREHKARSRAAGRWLFGMGISFALFGVFMGIRANEAAAVARQALAEHDANEEISVPDRDAPMKVSELMAELDSEVRRIFAVHAVLAASFIALSFWSRKAPLPAAITGLSLYLVIQVTNAIVEPASLVQGMVIKVLFILALSKTIASAISEQAWLKAMRERTEAEPVPAA